jgi:hypothetical protein
MLYILPLFIFFAIVPLGLSATSYPTPIQPDPTFQTGIVTVLSSSLTGSNTYTVSYNFMMATSSLNASIGIYSLDYNQK